MRMEYEFKSLTSDSLDFFFLSTGFLGAFARRATPGKGKTWTYISELHQQCYNKRKLHLYHVEDFALQ